MKKILLPVDGSDTCMKSFEYAKDLAQKYNSEIIILYSQDRVPPFGWVYSFGYAYDPAKVEDIDEDIEKAAKEIVEKAKEYFNGEEIKVTTQISTGDPAITIIEVAEKEECDIIIMCTHGMSASKRFLLGSVTNKVVHHAKTPVLVVR